MDAPLFIAARLRFKGRIAIASIAVSFIVMIISVSVSSGFRHEIRDGISFLSGDVQLTPVNLNYLDESSPVERYPAYREKIEALKGVLDVVPAVYKAGIVKTDGDIHGVLFKGIEDPGTAAGTDTLPSLGVSIPLRLASLLHLEPGDRLLSYFIGEKTRVRNFTVSSIYEGILDGDPENMVVFASLSDLQRLNGWKENQVSALEVILDRNHRDTGGMEEMQREQTNARGDVEPCVFIHYSNVNIRDCTLLEALKSPIFMAYHDQQPFNENMLRPCPMLENPEKLRAIVKETGARSTDYEAPEDADTLCDRTAPYAEAWQPVADALWNGEK